MRLLLIGAGGHGRAVLETLRDAGWPEPAGVLDDNPASAGLPGLPLLGPLALAGTLRQQGFDAAHVALGDNARRQALGEWLLGLGYALPVLRHPSAVVAGTARIGEGCVLLPRVVLGAAARVGRHVILNTGCIVEHDAWLEDAVHVAPGAVLGGAVRVGAAALVGLGAALRPGVAIGAGAVVGVGAAVVADVAPGLRVGGTPAVPLR
ncbi:acetyltransferase [Roseomonas marmotae]|uniref:Acetyltransferase n=1 Tax=Roseomonas marmotae TaxID=2768161 RepID=A0ABS3KDG5_9PROT|nr:acetyltransferase [Roseomonas marmotae]MBO1074975.1 acetyltransferase [Roseomonas marmotae]QTI79985.1 acetyltransferase [Roseomonas marmotae]